MLWKVEERNGFLLRRRPREGQQKQPWPLAWQLMLWDRLPIENCPGFSNLRVLSLKRIRLIPSRQQTGLVEVPWASNCVQRDGVGRLVFKDVELVGLPKKPNK